MARSARQVKILELIAKKEIETQDELANELQLANFIVTQATISRDIKELGLIKVNSNGKQKYAREVNDSNMNNKITNMFRHAVLSIDSAVNIIVIKTLAGGASTAGMMIDRLNNDGILGCVAGDDTVMAVAKNENVAREVVRALSEIINE